MSEHTIHPEILAPAGNPQCLEAAIAAGADAVYFGLRKLNARRGAANFPASGLSDLMTWIHGRGAKAYLTLNINLTQRELGLAARILALAEKCGVDGVLVCDPALLEMRRFFPALPFHFSTQAGISSSAGVKAAKQLGISRTVLARELSRQEIAAAATPDMELEVFVQGALCFSCSGRCLMSSWVGGRSGNRGACASPCRVAWKNPADGTPQRPLSMHDLCLAGHLAELSALGVASLKIEGRLKTADWVTRAVTLYRQALDNTLPPDELSDQAGLLGAYTGRLLTSGYYDSDCSSLTGEAARPAAAGPVASSGCQTVAQNPDEARFAFSQAEDNAVICDFAWEEYHDTLRIPPQRIANPRRATNLEEIQTEIQANVPRTIPLKITCPPEILKVRLPRRWTSAIQSFLDECLRQARRDEEDKIKVQLPGGLAELLAVRPPETSNRLRPDGVPDRIRLSETELPWLENNFAQLGHQQIILQIVPGETTVPDWLADCGRLTIALPQVIYENQIPEIRKMLEAAASRAWTVEVNSWDTWQLASEAKVRMEAGPGLAVFNANAARFLLSLGCRCATVSCELDRRQLEELCATAGTPLNLTVFGRPALMQTRAMLPEGFRPQDAPGFADNRDLQVITRQEGPLTVLRPLIPFDWRKICNPDIRAAHLTIDLTASPDPAREFARPTADSVLFNYDRRLR